jgi:LmbE family N-acetylglucosaminyl deacetylase
MLELIPRARRHGPLKILCLGAHCDDIEIGCGATLLTIQRRKPPIEVVWVILSGSEERCAESRLARSLFLKPRARGELIFGGFSDGRFPAEYLQIKTFVEDLKRFEPDIVLCHERDDRHQDHRLVNEMVWNTFRNHLVLEYEIPKWDGGLGQPNVYVPISNSQAKVKVNALLRAFRSQTNRGWFTADTFMALLRLRGLECRSPSGYAEAFHGRKLQMAITDV